MSATLSKPSTPTSRRTSVLLLTLAVGLSPIISWSEFVSADDQTPVPARHIVAFPEKTWGLAMDLTGFTTSIDDLKADGRRYLITAHPATGLNVSVILERDRTSASAEGCISHLEQLAASPIAGHSRDVQLTSTSTLPTLEYTVPQWKGITVAQRHVHLCYPKEDVYLWLHLSKDQYTARDELVFRTFLQSLQIRPVPPAVAGARSVAAGPSGSTLDLFRAASLFYLQGNYQQAIEFYEQALEQEKANPQLDRIKWRALVDDLGMAYGVSGKLAQARAIFAYGIQEDHTYPMFHYHLASTYAELNDRERTMASLRTAFRYRKHHNPGEPGVPDPRRDVSFRRLLAEDDFRAFVDRLLLMVQDK